MTEDIKTILRKYGCLFMADDNKEMLDEIEAFIVDREQQLLIPVVVKSLPQDNFCQVCNLPTDGIKCYSKRCPI
jgi:hypothetical protein